MAAVCGMKKKTFLLNVGHTRDTLALWVDALVMLAGVMSLVGHILDILGIRAPSNITILGVYVLTACLKILYTHTHTHTHTLYRGIYKLVSPIHAHMPTSLSHTHMPHPLSSHTCTHSPRRNIEKCTLLEHMDALLLVLEELVDGG